MHLAAEVLAGKAVGKLVQNVDGQDGEPDQHEGFHPIQVGRFSLDLSPVDQGEAEREQDEGGGADQKRGREAETEVG